MKALIHGRGGGMGYTNITHDAQQVIDDPASRGISYIAPEDRLKHEALLLALITEVETTFFQLRAMKVQKRNQ